MKKIGILLLCAVAVLSTKYFSSNKSEQSALLLNNIEALASDGEHAANTRCYGSGSVDCPIYHIKVEYVFGGYSLEELD